MSEYTPAYAAARVRLERKVSAVSAAFQCA